MSEGGRTESVWQATTATNERAALTEDTRADVCVIGAGIAGLTTAYLLAREGKSVVVLDDGPIGGGETGRTTAHLSNVIDDGYTEIQRLHGERGAQLAYESHTRAVDTIEEIVQRESIDCEFQRVDGFLFVPPGADSKELEDELEAARQAGFATAEMIARAPIDGVEVGPCIRFPNQGQFHILKYLQGVAQAAERLGVRIHGATHVRQIAAETTDRVAEVYVRVENGPAVTAMAVVVATNSPINDLVEMHTKQHPYRTYVSAARVAKGSVSSALFWDTLDPYHYVRLHPLDDASDVLIVGGEDHKTGQADDGDERHDRLENWMRQFFPQAGDVLFRWSGQVLEPVDGLAFIGRNPHDAPNIFIATGDSGMGMTHGTIAGILLTDLIVGRENAWETLYDPNRHVVRASGEYLREAGNMAAQYTDWLTRGDVASVDEIAPGEGAVMRRGLSKVAVYRDDQSTLHECSAVCPHLGCIVRWNSEEKTWDCPCHGSRFDTQGEVLNGPARSPLAPVDEK